MNIVGPYARIMTIHGKNTTVFPEAGIEAIRAIEWAGRISHRSEETQTEDSWQRFVPAVVMGHGDWSIVEHVSATVDMLVDRGITHEIVRHRLFSYTQECISGDTRLTPSLTIREAYDRQLVGRKIKSTDGTVIVKNRIAHIFHKGVQPVFAISTKSGYHIKTTEAHEFQIPGGNFIRLERLNIGDNVMVNGRPSLLAIDDSKLKSLFFNSNLAPAEIAEQQNVPYHTVTRRLRQLGVFRWRRNDKDLWKYNRKHTESSYRKMSSSITEGYRNGRKVWNKGLREADSVSVARMSNSLRTHHHANGFRENNSNWKGGVAKTEREAARRKKMHITACEVCASTDRLEVHHVDENPKNNQNDNLVKLCYGCHKKVHSAFRIGVQPIADTITSISYIGMEEVFDLEMKTYHNYVANGFIVHNSTRFVNYEKKMPPSFVWPEIEPSQGMADNLSLKDKRQLCRDIWTDAIESAEGYYRGLVTNGVAPQIARSVFPNALASRIIITGNLRNWRHFLLMRTTKEAHPQMRQVTIPLLAEFTEKIPLLFDDIKPNARQVDNLRLAR